jgi:hypothetical protein
MVSNLARRKGYRLGAELLPAGAGRKAARAAELRGWLAGPAGLSAEAAAAVCAEGLDSLDDLQDLAADPAALDGVAALTHAERARLVELAPRVVQAAPPPDELGLAALVDRRLGRRIGGRRGQNGGLGVALVERACAAASIRCGAGQVR